MKLFLKDCMIINIKDKYMIELENIAYNYKKFSWLNEVSFSLKKNDFCILFGPENAGKTLLIHIIMGFISGYQGNIKMFDHEINPSCRKANMKIRFIPEAIAWEENITIAHYLDITASESDNYDFELQNKLWQEFQLPTGKKMLQMSYEQNKLIQILTAVCSGPDILILDNPGFYLDSSTYERVLHYLRIWVKTGKIVLLASRDYPNAAKYANCYAYLKQGQLISFGRINRPDYRQKIVTVTGGDYTYLEKKMDKCIVKEKRTRVYLYTGNMKELPNILYTARCQDSTIEELTMEEELEKNYSGWE